MPRTLSRDEFDAIKADVLKHAPDNLSREEFERAVRPVLDGAIAQAENSPEPISGGAFGRFVSGLWQNSNPVSMVSGVAQAVVHPLDTLTAVGAAQLGQLQQARTLFGQGRYTDAAGHAVAGALPLVGPAAAQAGETMAGGDIAGGLGQAVGLILGMGAPAVASRAIKAIPKPRVSLTTNPAEAAAVAFGTQRGIPMDLATVTGSRFAGNVQKRLGGTVGGAAIVEKAQEAGQNALRSTLTDLAETVQQTPETNVSAGSAVTKALETQIQTLHKTATTAYDALRRMEQGRQGLITTYGGVQAPPGAAKPFTNVPMAVDIAATKQAVAPVYRALQREQELTGTLMGGKARTLVALDALMQAPDLAPLSVADEALSSLKAMARGANMPELRTTGQATAAQAVKALDTQVLEAAKRQGPDAVKALQEGRAATKAKWDTAEVLDTLRAEPAKVYEQLTANKDTAINLLSRVRQIAPTEVPKLARAYLDSVADVATAEGGFARTDKLFADWQRMGPQTKAMLFGPTLTKELDNFFLLAKRMGANPNPSGTANVLNALRLPEMIGYFPTKAIAALLYTPSGVRLLTRGLGATTLGPQQVARKQIAKELAKRGMTVGSIIPEDRAPE